MKRFISMITSCVMIFAMLAALPESVFSKDMVIKGFADEIEGKKVVQVALGVNHSACITEDGCLYTWGYNHDGRLGDGTYDHYDENDVYVNNDKYTPAKIMDNVAQVSLGTHHSACITKDGDLYTWGDNAFGGLGDGTREDKYTPVKIMDNVSKVSLGTHHSACITKDGTLYTWGQYYYGQLGDGTTEDRYTPVKIMDNVAQVSLGGSHSACITKDGALYTWGSNDDGELGDGTTENKYTPVKIMDNVAQVSLGGSHSACITKDGVLYTWGYSLVGQLGDGTTENKYTPVKIMDNVAQVSLGYEHSACITKDGALYMWGGNVYGELGDGTTENKHTPVKIMDNVAQVSLGSDYCACITKDEELYTWGANYTGKLGDGTTEAKHTPTKIVIPDDGSDDGDTTVDIPDDDVDEPNKKEVNNFRLERDNNSYKHSNGEGGGFYGRSNHIFSDPSYYNELLKNSSELEKFVVLRNADSDWHGSCYGVTLSMALVYGGYVSLSDITDIDADCYYELDPGPYYDKKFSNMIEYYHLSQYIINGGTNAVIAEAHRSNIFSSISLPATLAAMVDKASKNEPYLLSVGYRSMQTDDKGNKSEEPVGHAVLVLGCKETEDGFDLIIYNCNHREDFEYLSVSKDLKSFKYNGFKVSDGNELTQDNYRYLQVTDLEKMKNTPVLSPNIKNLGKSENSPKTISKVQGAEMNADNTTTISFNMDSSFVLHSRSGKTLSYDGESLDGDITVLDVSVTGDERPYYTVVIENDEEYVIENNGTVIDLLIYYNNEFYSVGSEGASQLIINKNGVTVSGQDYDYDAKAGVIIDGEPTLVSVMGNTSDSMTISAKDNKTTVTSDNELNDIKVTSFSPTKQSENKYESVDNSFEINGEDASIVTNGSDNEFAPGDVNGDGDINVTDVVITAAHVKSIRALDDKGFRAADVNGDDDVNVTDLSALAAHVKNIRPLDGKAAEKPEEER